MQREFLAFFAACLPFLAGCQIMEHFRGYHTAAPVAFEAHPTSRA